MKKTTYYVNGKKYDSLEQVPAELRALIAKTGPEGTAAAGAGAVDTVTRRYVFNGREYSSLAEMPAEARAFFEDKDGDGIPDIVNRGMAAMPGVAGAVYTCNGVRYSSLAEMPPEARALFEDKDGDGIPDIVNGGLLGGSVSVNVKSGFRVETRMQKSAPAAKAPSAPPSAPAAAPSRPQRQYRKQERPDRPGFWARLFGKKD